MKKLYNLKTVERGENHRYYTYEDGKKTPIPDDGVVYAYLAEETENGRMLKVTDFIDRAGHIDGKFVCTDEVTNGNGKPCVCGENYDVWGIGKEKGNNYVVVSARGDKFYVGADEGSKVVVTHPNQGDKLAAYKIIHSIYEMLVK
nr:MAG TPA: hypothetical protein [Caudoviricetes sp.]